MVMEVLAGVLVKLSRPPRLTMMTVVVARLATMAQRPMKIPLVMMTRVKARAKARAKPAAKATSKAGPKPKAKAKATAGEKAKAGSKARNPRKNSRGGRNI